MEGSPVESRSGQQRIVNVHQAKTHLSRLIDAAHGGETILLAKAGKPWARLMPLEASARLLALLSAEPAVEEVWLYGSRAMGRHHAGSDIDLTLVAPGLSHQGRLRLMGALDDLLLPWSIDLSLRHELPESLAQHVARVGRRLVP